VRRVTAIAFVSLAVGDVIVIPENLPHWWGSLDTDIRYLIFRPDPEGLQSAK
jgi:quercetin dioxygenase-like cupin family protein